MVTVGTQENPYWVDGARVGSDVPWMFCVVGASRGPPPCPEAMQCIRSCLSNLGFEPSRCEGCVAISGVEKRKHLVPRDPCLPRCFWKRCPGQGWGKNSDIAVASVTTGRELLLEASRRSSQSDRSHPPARLSLAQMGSTPPPPAALEPADRGPCLRTQLLLNGPYGFPRGHWITVY